MRKLALGLAGAGAVAVPLLLFGRSTTRGQAALAGTDRVRVARRDVGSAVKATGVVKPRIGAEVRVGSRVSGVVKRLFVRLGDTVGRARRWPSCGKRPTQGLLKGPWTGYGSRR